MFQVTLTNVPHLLMWFSHKNKIGENNFPLPIVDNISYYDTLITECHKLLTTNTPLYFCYMGRMLSENQKQSLELLSRKAVNLFVFDYDEIEELICVSDPLMSCLKERLKLCVDGYIRYIPLPELAQMPRQPFNTIGGIVDLCRLILISKPSAIKGYLETKYKSDNGKIKLKDIGTGILYRDFDRILRGDINHIFEINAQMSVLTSSTRPNILEKQYLINRMHAFEKVLKTNNILCKELNYTSDVLRDILCNDVKKYQLRDNVIDKIIQSLSSIDDFMCEYKKYKTCKETKDKWDAYNQCLGIKIPFDQFQVENNLIYVGGDNNDIIINILNKMNPELRKLELYCNRLHPYDIFVQVFKEMNYIDNECFITTSEKLEEIFENLNHMSWRSNVSSRIKFESISDNSENVTQHPDDMEFKSSVSLGINDGTSLERTEPPFIY